jgi:hypothetical protein
MRACRHDDVPSGGIVGGLIGAIDGPAIGQMRGGQTGGISIELLHSGRISPSTHSHVQDASARPPISKTAPTLTQRSTRFIGPLPPFGQRPVATAPSPRIAQVCYGLTFVLDMFS